MKVRVYYEDTDMAGVVYYANYLRFLERARTDFLEQRGVSIKALALQGIQITIKNVQIEYLSPAVYGDILDISTKVVQLKAAHFSLAHVIKRDKDGRLIANAGLTCVCVGSDFKPLRLPPEVRAALAS